MVPQFAQTCAMADFEERQWRDFNTSTPDAGVQLGFGSLLCELRKQYSTRSQVVARIADRTASQHLLGSHDVIGHVTI